MTKRERTPKPQHSEVIMKERRTGTQEKTRFWVGIDWGTVSHAVSVVDDERTVVEQFEVGVDLSDFRQLVDHLNALGAVAGIAIETTRNPLVGHLASERFTIYPVNPKLSKNWRDSNSVAGVKSDKRDGLVLALELARRHESLRPFKKDEPAVAELAGLCEKLRDLIDLRTSLVQRLKATLRQYYPAAMGFFSDWTSPVAWRFLKRFPRPETLAHARKDTLIKFLKANRIGLKPMWLERIDSRGEAAHWPKPADSIALEAMALATVAQLQALQPYIDKCDRLIAQRSKDLPQVQLLRSLPGAGKRLAPALAAITALTVAEQGNCVALRCVSGVAPVEVQSGKRRRARMRRRCNKHWRNIMHLFAKCSTGYCAWAKAFYDLHREQGDRHAAALRKLADKWFKIINRMLDTGESYDDQRYIEALRKHGSPVYQKLCEKRCQ
jgi:transposase